MDKFFDLVPGQTPKAGLPYIRRMSKKAFEKVWAVWERQTPVERVRVIYTQDGAIERIEIRIAIPLMSPLKDNYAYVLYLVHTVFKPESQQRLYLSDKEKS